MNKRLPLMVALAMVPAFAQAGDVGPWQFKVGVHAVDPKSDNGSLAGGALDTTINTVWRPSIALEYYFSPNLGLEVLGALPFRHDVRLNGARSASVKHLPPTVTLQWHFAPGEKVNPFVGLGLNYTRFFSIEETGPLAGTQLNLDASWGLAAHAGIDFAVSDRWSVGIDARWIDIDAEAKVNGAKVGTVNIDPLVYGISFGYRF